MKHCLFFLILVLTGCGVKEAQQADQRMIDQLMTERRSEILACYDEAVKKRPSLPGGRMTLRAQQHIDGSLHSTQMIKGFAGSNDILDCVVDRINSWKTDPPKTWGSVELSFDFRNERQESIALSRDFGSAMKERNELVGICFERELAQNPSLQGGQIKFRFLRTKDGRIENIEKLSGFAGDARIYQCVEEIVRSVNLEPTENDSTMLWTQNFKRNDALVEQPRSTTELK